LVPESELIASQVSDWKECEDWLISQTELKMAVWFALDTEDVSDFYANVLKESTSSGVTSTDQTTLVVEAKEPAAMKKYELSNIQGLLTGLTTVQATNQADSESSTTSDVTKIPTVAITAQWDSFSSVPGLAYGANSDASGVVTLFHIVRSVSKLYTHSRTQARCNVVFLFSSGSHLNYAGTRHWIDASATGSAIRDSLDWVLSIDGIGQQGELFLHASRPAKDPNAARLYDTFTQVAERHGIPFSVVQKKINIAESSIGWEHEVFARRKILAATLSQSSKPNQISGIFDQKKAINAEALERNILFVTEVVTRLIYNQDKNAPAIVTSVNSTLTQGWLNAITHTPRMVPFLDSKHPVVDYLESTLKQYAGDVSRQTFKPDIDRTFYDSTSAKLTSYRTQSFTFDLVLLLIVLAFNGAIYAALKGIGPALSDFGSLLVWIKNRFVPGSSPTSSSTDKKVKRN
jgi:hypothetical protein